MDLDDLVGDRLPVNQPYNGLVAEAYDVWLSPDKDYGDVDLYRRAIEQDGGPALELGCGNGRLLVKYLRAGLDVEGVDAAADMLAICDRHAREAGVTPTLHHADWRKLDLGKQYATLYNPAGSFALNASDDDARTALRCWLTHIAPGGSRYASMGVPPEERGRPYTWRVRRSGTRAADHVTFMVHEAYRRDAESQTTRVLNKHEVWDADGRLVTTFIRRLAIRWWTRDQMETLFRDCGYVDVRSDGSDTEFVTRGARAT